MCRIKPLKEKMVNYRFNLHKDLTKEHLLQRTCGTDFNFRSITRMGSFNAETLNSNLESFCTNYVLKNLIKETVLYKNHSYGSCVDLLVTNCPGQFKAIFCHELDYQAFEKWN